MPQSADQQAIDAPYDLRAAVPDYETYFAQWRRDSARALQSPGWRRDIAYGPDAEERLDIFTPPGAQLRPVHVFFHGGYWRALGKDEFSFVALWQPPGGVITVVVNYALCPTVTIADIVAQCARALAWIGGEIAAYGGDPERIYVTGHSAGGHIAAMLMLTNGAVRGGMAISGVFDLEPVRHTFLNADLRLSPDDARRNSPLRLMRPFPGALAVAVGDGETTAFRDQSREFVAAATAAGNRCTLVVVPGTHHYSILDAFVDDGHPLSRALRETMEI
jgi:arylformamidase